MVLQGQHSEGIVRERASLLSDVIMTFFGGISLTGSVHLEVILDSPDCLRQVTSLHGMTQGRFAASWFYHHFVRYDVEFEHHLEHRLSSNEGDLNRVQGNV